MFKAFLDFKTISFDLFSYTEQNFNAKNKLIWKKNARFPY